MFFDIVLLNYQHNGNFGKAWIAGTRGIRFISTQDIVSINICRLCHDLYKFIVSSSGDPKKRFSLRMSAILLHGTIRIHNKQVVILQVDAVKVLQRCTIPEGSRLSLYEEEEQSEEHSPHITVKAKRQKKKKQTQPQLTPIDELAPEMQRFDEGPIVLPQAGDTFRHPAHSEVITMRETEIASKTRLPEEGFGDISVEEILDLLERAGSPQQLQLHRSPQPARRSATGSSSESTTVAQPVEITVQAQVHARRGSYIEESGPQPVRAELTGKEPTVIYPTVQEPSAITPMEIEHTAVQPSIPMEVIEIVPSAKRVPPAIEKETAPPVDIPAVPAETAESVGLQVESTQPEAAPRPAAVRRKHKITEEDRRMLNRLMVKTKPTTAVITRCLRGKNQFTGPEVRYRLTPVDEPNTKRLYELLWDDEMETVEGAEQVRAAEEASREDQIRVSTQLPEIASTRSTLDQRYSEERLSTPKEASVEEQRRSRRTDRHTPIRPPSVRVEEPLPLEEMPIRQTREFSFI